MYTATETLIVEHVAHAENATDVRTAFSAGVEANLPQIAIYQAFERGVADRRVHDTETEVLGKLGYLYGGVIAVTAVVAKLVNQSYESVQTSLEYTQPAHEAAQSNTYVFGGLAVLCGVAGGIQHWRARRQHRKTEDIVEAMAAYRPRVR